VINELRYTSLRLKTLFKTAKGQTLYRNKKNTARCSCCACVFRMELPWKWRRLEDKIRSYQRG